MYSKESFYFDIQVQHTLLCVSVGGFCEFFSLLSNTKLVFIVAVCSRGMITVSC